jgi:hypothetical protein
MHTARLGASQARAQERRKDDKQSIERFRHGARLARHSKGSGDRMPKTDTFLQDGTNVKSYPTLQPVQPVKQVQQQSMIDMS